MKFVMHGFILLALVGSGGSAGARLTREQQAQLPPPAPRTVQFDREIKPLLETSCLHCHGRGKTKGGFNLETRETLLQGGDSGPAVIPGRSAESYLIELVSGLDADNVMPLKGNRLSAEQVGLLRAWIDQDLPWPVEFSFAKQPPRNLTPRQPDLPPAGDGWAHPVDRLLRPYYAHHQITPGPVVDDRRFARRVYLDVVGLLPPPGELEAFLKDERPEKRERLVDRLLADDRRYAEHWLTFWNDALRNDYRGTGYIDGGRKQISGWLFSALTENLAYDRFVAELVSPKPAAEGFVRGILWRGVVNASQTPQLQAAQNISQLFMGVNLKCASCHDSFINDWTLADAYGLAAVYADEPLEMYECDKPTGQTAAAKFIYPELGTIPASAPKPEKQRRLAEILTSRENGRLSRTIVNRLWQTFMGVGLVEPADEMEQPAWHPDLLDWLAEDLVAHTYNLKHTMKRILTSRAYQLPAVSVDDQAHPEFVFTGPSVRRMTAEQFRDALGTLTGVWYEQPALPAAAPAAATSVPTELNSARWIWTEAEAAAKALPQRVYLWKTFTLDALPGEARLVAAADNSYTVFVNGRKLISGSDWNRPQFADLLPLLKAGRNLIAVTAANHRPDNSPPKADATPDPAEANPAGFILHARLQAGDWGLTLNTDASWRGSPEKPTGWPGLEPAAAGPAVELGAADVAPWKAAGSLASAWSLAEVHGETRASLVPADPLTAALGRPPREQMTTRRASMATTLQALELTNGKTLTRLLEEGARKLAATPSDPEALVRDLYAKGLGRPPAAQELALAREAIGGELQPEPLEDFLWALTMLPEFQLIY